MQQAPILIIDDDPAILDTVSEILQFEGYTVLTASNGAAGLQCVEQIQPSIVLLDMRMPILDGWGFARALKQRGINLPIVVMTAAQDARRWAEEVEATAYLSKPFDLVELLAIIERLQGATV
jgi:CheY-like chemotaxis protein